MPPEITAVGTHAEAQEIACAHEMLIVFDQSLPEGWRVVGCGRDRTAYLSPSGVVYKVAEPGSLANEREASAFRDLASAGAGFVPPFTLHQALTTYGDEIAVIAMPYLPDDGSVGTIPMAMLLAGGDFNLDNVHASGGKLWLIDAGGI